VIAPLRRAVLASAVCLLAATPVPQHVQTSDYFGGYAGTRLVAPDVAARWLTWAETNIPDSVRMLALGVKTLLYTDPYRTMQGDPDLPPNGQGYAYDCSGNKIEARRAGQYLMDPSSPAVLAQWKSHVSRYSAEGHFTAVFADDAGNLAYLRGVPCHSDQAQWIDATNALQRALGYPVVYNGLSNFTGSTISPTIALNASSIGGVMEQCYAASPKQPKTPGTAWTVEENTELRMAQDRKLFFCYGNDTTQAAQAIDGRLYAYASFLLSYDLDRSVLWEAYASPSRLHAMPETQLVAMQPAQTARTIDDLKTSGGTYVRTFGACYIAARNQGPCAVAVNPDALSSHALSLSGYRRTLRISGSGTVDGGTIDVVAAAPPSQLAPVSAVIAFK